jgi:hypothetical protein
MPLIKQRWKAQHNCTVIEKFYYTDDGHWHAYVDVVQKQHPKADVHEGRIMLCRDREGKFFVDWSTRNMLEIKSELLGQVRESLKDYLDSVRTKTMVSDMESWTPIIAWTYERATKGLVLTDDNDKVVRFARWDDAKKQYVPVERHSYEISVLKREPYGDERWKQIQADQKTQEAYAQAHTEFERALGHFHLQDHNLTWLKVLTAMRNTYKQCAKTLLAAAGKRKNDIPM